MSSYEEKILQILKKNRIKLIREKSYKNFYNGRYRYDFYLPEQNILIEVDGEYHFKNIRGEKVLSKQQEHDRRKNNYAIANNIPLYRIPYWDINKLSSFSDITQEKYLVKSMWHNDDLKPL